jgi:RNase P subunit RPR2
MELYNLLGIIVTIIFATIGLISHFGFIALIIFLALYPYYQKRKQTQIWQQLAQQYGLTFQHSNLFTTPQLFGLYKSHHLKLKAVSQGGRNNRKVYTQAIISLAQPEHDQLTLRPEDLLHNTLTKQDIIQLFNPAGLQFNYGEKIETMEQGRQISYRKEGVETDLTRLITIFDWLIELLATYPAIVARGGEAIPYLQQLATSHTTVNPIAKQLIRDISRETGQRLRHHGRRLFCPHCLTCCDEHKVELSWLESASYYGCRSCGQSRQFLEGQVAIAILDNQSLVELSQQHGSLYVNWSIRRQLFDFSDVKIVNATDEEVERFAVQIGNDTDPFRRDRYKQIHCSISPGCQLSPNTLKILKRTFGQVLITEVVIDDANPITTDGQTPASTPSTSIAGDQQVPASDLKYAPRDRNFRIKLPAPSTPLAEDHQPPPSAPATPLARDRQIPASDENYPPLAEDHALTSDS